MAARSAAWPSAGSANTARGCDQTDSNEAIHGEDIPAIPTVRSRDRDELFALAQHAIEDLTGHGLDALTVELVLDMLCTARDLDQLGEP